MFINTTWVTVMLAEANRGTSVSPTYSDFKASSVSKLSITGKCSIRSRSHNLKTAFNARDRTDVAHLPEAER